MKNYFLIAGVCVATLVTPLVASAATLSLNPSAGTFTVGSTFTVSVFLDTEGKSVNAVQISLSFPPDKLQLVSPASGQSVIGVWTSPPRYDNSAGTISFQGGMPGGINVSDALISTFTFRVKSVGAVIVKFLDGSRVLLNDGIGTDALERTRNGVYDLALPPPAGPTVTSETHPDQSRWYPNPNVLLTWGTDASVEGFSYILSDNPVDNPDNISEGLRTGVSYKNLADGTHYFHIRALRSGVWGGITHFALNIDTTPPADFPVQIVPSSPTLRRQVAVLFSTTDALSGIDYYELKIVPLGLYGVATTTAGSPLFIEAQSPYVTPVLDLGSYDVIVRAYDKAGNYRDVTEPLRITTAIFQFIENEGLSIRNQITIPWVWVWIVGILLLAGLGYLAVHLKRWHRIYDLRRARRELPKHIQESLHELKKFRARYGHTIFLLLLISALLLSHAVSTHAQLELSTPVVTDVSKNIANDEIFYIGGKTNLASTTVTIYLQNLENGETLSQNVVSDANGDWFYRHNTFLPSGDYLLWVQSRLGDVASPPSAQVQMTVRPTAIQFGASRLSLESFYLILVVLMFIAIVGLLLYNGVHVYRVRRKHVAFVKEAKEADESVRRGFAILRRDIEAELAVVRKAKLKKDLSASEKEKESQLIKDLAAVEKYIGKEVWDVEKLGGVE